MKFILFTFLIFNLAFAQDNKCGTSCTYTLENNVLTISGTGEMKDFSESGEDTPWYKSRETITKVTIGDKIESIGKSAFYSFSAMTTVTIPGTVTSIGENAFIGCEKLATVTLPEALTTIGKYAFNGCKALKSITIPAKVKIIHVKNDEKMKT